MVSYGRLQAWYDMAVRAGLERVLMHPFTSSHLAFAFVPSTTLIGQPHLVVVDPRMSAFCVLQSRINETWVRFTSSTVKDDLSYKIARLMGKAPPSSQGLYLVPQVMNSRAFTCQSPP
jgi:hypothetical protein